jgi:hypothetical protein
MATLCRKLACFIASLSFGSLTFAATPISASTNCTAECAKGFPVLCLIIPSLVAGPDIPWALKHLHLFIFRKNVSLTIAPKQMLGFFGMSVSDDPCVRGDTAFTGNAVSNAGQRACQIAVSVPLLGGATNVQIGFDVPVELKARLTRDHSRQTLWHHREHWPCCPRWSNRPSQRV